MYIFFFHGCSYHFQNTHYLPNTINFCQVQSSYYLVSVQFFMWNAYFYLLIIYNTTIEYLIPPKPYVCKTRVDLVVLIRHFSYYLTLCRGELVAWNTPLSRSVRAFKRCKFSSNTPAVYHSRCGE